MAIEPIGCWLSLERRVADACSIDARSPQLRILGFKLFQNLLDGRIYEQSTIIDILHVSAAVDVEFVEKRIAPTVEKERLDTESLTHLTIKCGCNFEHVFAQPERHIAMLDEKVRLHEVGQLYRV